MPAAIAAHAESAGAVAVAVSARIESELGELGDDAEADAMRAELGVGESGLERVIHGAWQLLDLISFFTADTAKEAMARAIAAGSTAHEAAGKVHTDIQQRVRARRGDRLGASWSRPAGTPPRGIGA